MSHKLCLKQEEQQDRYTNKNDNKRSMQEEYNIAT